MPKVKIPKRVGGVKIPKKVRKRANKALEMAESPAMRDLGTAALDGFRRFLEGFEEGLREAGNVVEGEAREKANGSGKATRPSPGEPA